MDEAWSFYQSNKEKFKFRVRYTNQTAMLEGQTEAELVSDMGLRSADLRMLIFGCRDDETLMHKQFQTNDGGARIHSTVVELDEVPIIIF